jgi:hypothetical protein
VHVHHSFKIRCVKNSANIHISTYSFPYLGDVGRHTFYGEGYLKNLNINLLGGPSFALQFLRED